MKARGGRGHAGHGASAGPAHGRARRRALPPRARRGRARDSARDLAGPRRARARGHRALRPGRARRIRRGARRGRSSPRRLRRARRDGGRLRAAGGARARSGAARAACWTSTSRRPRCCASRRPSAWPARRRHHLRLQLGRRRQGAAEQLPLRRVQGGTLGLPRGPPPRVRRPRRARRLRAAGLRQDGDDGGSARPALRRRARSGRPRVLRAIDRGAPVVYAPPIWRVIMLAIRMLPRAVMRRVRF